MMLLQVLARERVEDDQLVDAVQELGPEVALDLVHELVLHLARSVASSSRGLARSRARAWFLISVGADVRRHDQDRVAEVDVAAERVGQPALLHDLEEHVEDVGVRLLDLVESTTAVRTAAHLLGELAALLVADVARRRADEPATRCASPCTRTCRSWISASSSPNMNFASCLREVASCRRPWGPRKMNEPIGRRGSFRPERERRTALRDRLDRLVLADDGLVELVLHLEQALGLGLLEPRQRDAGHLARRSRRSRPRRRRRRLARGLLAPLAQRSASFFLRSL